LDHGECRRAVCWDDPIRANDVPVDVTMS
jgi:hypothetical protein